MSGKRLAKTKPLETKMRDNDSDDSSSSNEKKRGTKPKSTPTVNNKFSKFLSLEATMNNITQQVFKNDRFVCIRDKYPKSRFHLLLIPLASVSNGVKLAKLQDLIRLKDSVDVLKEMKRLAEEIVHNKCPSDLKPRVKFGFHAIQSMNPLHMHIISTDFNSDALKTKKHWNSFTSSYFVGLSELIEHLETTNDYFVQDKFNLDKSGILKSHLDSQLKCHVCGENFNTMPNLKTHIAKH